jgi:hypothetical protein
MAPLVGGANSLPMEREGKAGGGLGGSGSFWLLCVVVVVVFCVFLATLLVEKLRSGQPK